MHRLLAILALAAAAALPVHAQRVPLPIDGANFTAEQLLRGVSATQAECDKVSGLWAALPSGETECLRYWSAGLAPGANPKLLVYLTGDQITGTQAEAGYATRGPAAVQAIVDGYQKRLGVPFVLLARPGTFGSSGDHRQRRREPEARLVSAALDALKARHGVDELSLAGLSGGGHTVAALLGWRKDITCAVAASAVSSPRLRWERKGWTADATGFTDSYEPVAQLKAGAFHPRLRVFVLGDEKDSNVPWPTQLPLAQRLRELGVATEVVTGEGTGGERHILGASAQALGAQCLQGRDTPAILDAARALRG